MNARKGRSLKGLQMREKSFRGGRPGGIEILTPFQKLCHERGVYMRCWRKVSRRKPGPAPSSLADPVGLLYKV